MMWICGVLRAMALTSSSTILPVASPPACTTRLRLCAASNPRNSVPSGCLSKRTPAAMSRRTCSAPSRVRISTAFGSHRPAPAASVSCACSFGSSSGKIAAAIPPCAWYVFDSTRSVFVMSTTSCPGRPASGSPFATASAALNPAMPAPMTAMVGSPGVSGVFPKGVVLVLFGVNEVMIAYDSCIPVEFRASSAQPTRVWGRNVQYVRSRRPSAEAGKCNQLCRRRIMGGRAACGRARSSLRSRSAGP